MKRKRVQTSIPRMYPGYETHIFATFVTWRDGTITVYPHFYSEVLCASVKADSMHHFIPIKNG